MEKTKREDAINEMTLLLMYLNKFHDDGRRSLTNADRAWKGYDFAALDALDRLDYIRQGAHSGKSVVITRKGVDFARELLKKYEIEE